MFTIWQKLRITGCNLQNIFVTEKNCSLSDDIPTSEVCDRVNWQHGLPLTREINVDNLTNIV